MSDPAETRTVSKRRWPYTVPALGLGLGVVLWQGGIEKGSWCVACGAEGQARIVEYTPPARFLLPVLALGAFASAGWAIRKLIGAGADRRDPAVMSMVCVLVAMAVLWLLQTHGVWADSVRIGPDTVIISQTQWLIRRSDRIPYRQLSSVAVGRHKWVFRTQDHSAKEVHVTPLLRAVREELLAAFGQYGARIVYSAD